MNNSRRDFIQKTGSLVAAATLSSFSSHATVSANEKLTVALIGCKGMGFYNLQDHLKVAGVECVALCDVDENILNERAVDVLKLTGKSPKLYKDYRKVMDDKSVDIVIIGTPDHWHCLPMVHACEVGKDVYVEKPLANSIGECEVMVKAARKYNRVVQVGQQQRSGEHWMEAMEMIRSGKLGQLRKVNIWANFNYAAGGDVVPDEPLPSGVDFDMWLGPAPKRSFNKARFHGSWRMFWDYGGGLMSDWGVHLIDMALWPKNIKEAPLSISASGGNFAYPNRAHETFDTQTVTFQMKDYLITWENNAGLDTGPYDRQYGLAFACNDATLVIDRDGYELFPEKGKDGYRVPAVPKRNGRDSHFDHVNNFIECVKSRKDPNCPIENGRLVALYAHMGNIAVRTQSRLVWNESSKNFGNNSAANALITPNYRAPWKLPVM